MFWEIDLCFGKLICVLGNCYVFWEIDLCLSLLGHRSKDLDTFEFLCRVQVKSNMALHNRKLKSRGINLI